MNFSYFKVVLDDLDFKIMEDQFDNFVKLLDTNQDHKVSYSEITDFVESYNPKFTMSSNLMTLIGNQASSTFQKMTGIKYELSDSDYHNGIKTILYSETAALVKAEEIYNSIPKGEKFLDEDFGPVDDNDAEGSNKALYFSDPPPPGYARPEDIIWMNAKDINNGEKVMFVSEDASANDVIQGQIGNCWFIGALSVIATRDDLLRGGMNKEITPDMDINPSTAQAFCNGVYPPIFHIYRKRGIWVFRFFKDFQWMYVIIDNRLPCFAGSKKPVFGRCRSLSELWVPLIEKAYAKIHGNYESLISGYIDDGITDMTGFVSEKMYLQDKRGNFPNPKLPMKENFFGYLLQRHKEKCLMGCAIKGDEGKVEEACSNGLIKGHAYGIIDVFEIENADKDEGGKHHLIAIRNPWGKSEWEGDWSDESDLLDQHREQLKAHIEQLEKDDQYNIGEEDGIFYMSFDDFVDHYNKLYIAVDFPDSWSGRRYKNEWSLKYDNCGGLPNRKSMENWAKNPQYLVTNKHTQPVEFFISLAQEDARMIYGLKYPYAEKINPVNFTIIPTKGTKPLTKFPPQKEIRTEFVSTVTQYKEVSLRVMLEPGNFIIVPSTSKPDMEGQFILSIYFNFEPDLISIKYLAPQSQLNFDFKASKMEKFSNLFERKSFYCR